MGAIFFGLTRDVPSLKLIYGRDFVRIQKELERISVTVETLQLWVEKMLANGRIDTEAYNKESEAP